MFFQNKLPIARTRRPGLQRRKVRYGVNSLVETMSASLTGRLTYAALGRLGGIVQYAIGDMVASWYVEFGY